jgi:hypothetical protein
MESIKLTSQEGSLVISADKITVGFGELSIMAPKGNINAYKEFLKINSFDLAYNGLNFAGPYYLTKFSRNELIFLRRGRISFNEITNLKIPFNQNDTIQFTKSSPDSN